MRKILIGVLSVAGLLATVLALASSPATSQMVIAFRTDNEPGKYTVNWSTQGGCDPSKPDADTTLATDGATGSISRTVAVPGGTAGSATVGLADADDINGIEVEFSVAVAGHCSYEWSGSFASNLGGSNGIRCAMGVGDDVSAAVSAAARDGSLDIEEDPTEIVDSLQLGVDEDVCNVLAKISVDVDRTAQTRSEREGLQPTSGAILNTTFTVGARQVTANNAATNDECETVTADTEVDDQGTDVGKDATDDDTVGAVLTVVRTPLSDGEHSCGYDVGVIVPAGFEPRAKNTEGSRVLSYVVNPATRLVADDGDIASGGRDDDTDPDSLDNSIANCGDTVTTAVGADGTLGTDDDDTTTVQSNACVSADIVVALRMMYILQNVVGDSGGADARYSLTLDKECAIPHDLPHNLTGELVGGIRTTPGVTVVELKEGFYNISAAVMGRATTDTDDYGRTFAPRYALNKDGEACSFTAKVSHLPDICDAAEDVISANAVTGADSHGRVIVTFDIGCSDDAADDAAEADDGAADDMGDMDDIDDDAADDDADMGDMGDDDADAMGPPADEPTG